jgi:hypothetical protein
MTLGINLKTLNLRSSFWADFFSFFLFGFYRSYIIRSLQLNLMP